MNSRLALTLQNLRRAKTSAALSICGVAIAVSFYLFFGALGAGVDQNVIQEVQFTKHLTVMPQTKSLGIFETDDGPKINKVMIKKLKNIVGVATVAPRVGFKFPAGYQGRVSDLVNDVMKRNVMPNNGQRISFEMIADGLPPKLVQDDFPTDIGFDDFRAGKVCEANEECAPGARCIAGTCELKACRSSADKSCPANTYCAEQISNQSESTFACEPPIPVVISQHLLEMYNGGIATAMNLPKISETVTKHLNPTLEIRLGRSFISRGKSGSMLKRRLKLVGISRKAIAVGVTMPLPYVLQFNRHFNQGPEQQTFQSALVELIDQQQLYKVKEKIETLGLTLDEHHLKAEQASRILTSLQWVMTSLSVLFLLLVALNLSQNFLLLVIQRRSEIGLYRCLGAKKTDIHVLLLSEASVIGILGTVLGTSIAIAAMVTVDHFLPQLPDFPYKPESLFVLSGLQVFICVGVVQIFCMLGALIPTRKAAHMSPIRALQSARS